MALSSDPSGEVSASREDLYRAEAANRLLDFPNPHLISVEGRQNLMTNLLRYYGCNPSDTRFHQAIIRLSEEPISFQDVQLAARFAVAGDEGEINETQSGRAQYNRLIAAAIGLNGHGDDLTNASLHG